MFLGTRLFRGWVWGVLWGVGVARGAMKRRRRNRKRKCENKMKLLLLLLEEH